MKFLHRHWRILVLVLVLICISTFYLSTAFGYADGRPVAPLDDAYITYQYARQIARGYPYRYNDTDAPTTGMTSPLFGFFLAGIYRLGFYDESLTAFAISMGVVWLGLTTWLTYRLASHILGEEGTWSWIAAAFVLLTGSLQWGCFNGMETGLFTVLSLAAIDAFITHHMGWCALWLSLSGLTRPEGLILALILSAVILLDGLLRNRSIPWGTLVILSATVFTGFIPMVINYVLTGTFSAAGLQAKSWTGNVPAYLPGIIRSIFISYRRILIERFMGKDWYVIPGLLLFTFWGWCQLVREKQWFVIGTTLLWFGLGTASTSLLMTALWHLGRYQIPFIPTAVIVSVYGLRQLSAKTSMRWVNIAHATLLLTFLAFSLFTTVTYIEIYHRAISTVARQQLVLADWMRDNLPHDAIVGIHDAGSLRYIGDRRTYDLIGLTTPQAAVPWRHGAGSVYELMEQAPMRPTHFAIYPDVFSIPYLANTDLFAEELFKVSVPDHTVASAGPVQGVWKANWHLANSGVNIIQEDIRRQVIQMEIVDKIDIADLADESTHNVSWWQKVAVPGFPTEVQQQFYRVHPEKEVIDGGRLLTGGIEFDMTTEPGKDLWLVSRLHARQSGAVRVIVDGNEIGHWMYPPVPKQWLETLFYIPGDVISSEQTRIQIIIDNDVPGFQHYAIYYIWALQGKVSNYASLGERNISAIFNQYFTLHNFDLSFQVLGPGDVLSTTLYWSSTESTLSAAKVFLHLYKADGTLDQQSDSWAYYGTRPPYTWRPNEIIYDPRNITLPQDIAPGTYTLEVGLYDEKGRLPAYIKGVKQSEGRVVLTQIEILAEKP